MHRLLTATTLAVLWSVPALAQAPICGGISLVGEWVGGTEEASDITMAGAAFDADGQVPIAGHLVRMFTLSQPGDIRAEVAAVPAGDPYVSIYDESGTEVAADDDSGGDFAARVEASLPAGTYCLAARSYESGVTDVAVRIGRPSHEPLTTGGAGQTDAPSIGLPGEGAGCGDPGVTVIGRDLSMVDAGDGLTATGTAGRNPGFAFSLLDPMPLTITADSIDGDPLITLLDATGTSLGENDDFDGLNSRIDMVDALPAGEYCIALQDLNGEANDITVGLRAFDPAADRRRRLNAAEFAPTALDDVAITDLGVVQSTIVHDVTASGAAKWLRFDLPDGGLLVTEGIGSGDADPTLVLFDRVGRRVAENDDGPEGLDSFMATRLLPGSYLLAVRLVDQSASGPVRILLERFVPAQ
ncbi:MAG: ABC transporter substrate-binding protein [Jannaschia sp.]